MIVTPLVTVDFADQYMATVLDSEVWDAAAPERKYKALCESTLIMDTIEYIGVKMDSDQPHAFPRFGLGTPDRINFACVEIASELIKGRNINFEVESLMVVGEGDSPARTSYDRSQVQEHVRNGIISYKAWAFMQPYVADNRTLALERS